MAAPYLTPADLRGRVQALADVNKYSDAALAEIVAEFEALAESYCAVAFTPRTTTETYSLPANARTIPLNWPRVRSVASIVVDGNTISSTTYRVTEYGTVESLAGFITTVGYPAGQAVVTYDHGYDVPTSTTRPGAIVLHACQLYVSIVAPADRSGVSRDVVATQSGNMTTRYSTPNWERGNPTGWLDVDRLLNTLPNYRTPTFA